jgi:hypothetical protein
LPDKDDHVSYAFERFDGTATSEPGANYELGTDSDGFEQTRGDDHSTDHFCCSQAQWFHIGRRELEADSRNGMGKAPGYFLGNDHLPA